MLSVFLVSYLTLAMCSGQKKAKKHLTDHTAVVGRPHGCRMRLCCLAAVVVSTNAHKLGLSRRTALGAGASAAFAAPAHAASELVNFEDGTIGLRFQYPKGWRCRGTGALMGLVAGNRVTTCIAVHEANCRGCFRRRGGVVSPTP